MSQEQIDGFREALRLSPNNTPIRLMLTEALLKLQEYKEAESEALTLLANEPHHTKAKFLLATSYYHLDKNSAALIILEELENAMIEDVQYLLLYTRSLLKDQSFGKASQYFQKAKRLDSHLQEDDIEAQLKIPNLEADFSEDYEDEEGGEEDSPFLEKPSVNFDDVGGLENVKKEIDIKIIKPLEHAELYRQYGKKVGGGILLYGPPGCGKSHLARATAGQINAKFLSVGINQVLDMWIGQSEQNLHELFETARRNSPCVLFFDEVDALGASRSDMRQSAGRHLINQFLSEMDGVENNNDGLLILGATNAPWHLDAAFRRPGRFDRIVFVPPPDEAARESILEIKLKGKPLGDVNYKKLASATKEFSGADIEAVVDIAIEEKLTSSFETGIPEPITTKDLTKAAKKHKATTKEWFGTARNYALYSNESGLYDDILTYLKIKK